MVCSKPPSPIPRLIIPIRSSSAAARRVFLLYTLKQTKLLYIINYKSQNINNMTGTRSKNNTSECVMMSAADLEKLMTKVVTESVEGLIHKISILEDEIQQLRDQLAQKSVIHSTNESRAELEPRNTSSDIEQEIKNNLNSSTDTVVNAKVSDKKKTRPKKKEPQVTNQVQNKHKTIRGCNESDTFSAVVSRAWVYVDRARKTTTCDEVRKFLEGKYNDQNFVVEALPSNENAISASFKVGATASLLDELYKPENWPHNILVKRFKFFRGRQGNFVEKKVI